MTSALYFILAILPSWLAYHSWRLLRLVFQSVRGYKFKRVFLFDLSKAYGLISTPQPEIPSTPSPVCLSASRPHSDNPKVIQLPRLYPIFPADGLKGDTTVDIIAVHGIETISPKTWTAYERDTEPRGRSFYWLKDANMLPSVVKGARIWAFDYNSNYSHDAQTVKIDGLAMALLNCMKDRRGDFESRKIIFIGSCFGGVVVAEALLTAFRDAERKKALFDQTAGVIFLGSPLRGTKAATFAGWKNLIFGILGPDQESSDTLLDDLKENSSRLENLVAEFGKLTVRSRTQAGIEVRCFYETRKTQVSNAISRNLPVKEMLLVDKVSACLDCHEHIPLDVRHAMMNKYRGPEDPNFKLVSGRIKDMMDKIRADRSLTGDEKKCMQALSFPYQDQKDVNPERVEGTCEWFLQHEKFLAWCQDTTKNLLWVTAGPGCGKSVLSKALVDEGLLHAGNPDTKTASICYFFFKDDAERGSGINALRSILHQLFRQKPWLIKEHAIPDYEIHGPKFPFRTLWNILIKAASDANAGPIICLFDALDECELSNRNSLINYISSFHRDSKTSTSKLKFIVTSRPYNELSIEFKVDDLPSIQLDGNEVSENICREVDLVIASEITRIGSGRRPPLSDGTQTSLIQHLKTHNNRTYLWVYLMLQEISRSLESTERRLTRLIETIPLSVNEAYENILKRATKPYQAQRVLRLILAAERPLTLKEMNIALEILDMEENGDHYIPKSDRKLELDRTEAEFQRKIEDFCGLFVSIVDQKIYLIHQTAKEFLTSNNGILNSWSPLCWENTFAHELSHLEALKACMWYLQLEFRTSRSFLSYASINWTFHFQQAGKYADEELGKDALQLCDTTSQRFSLWFRELGLERWGLPPVNSNDLIITCTFGLVTAVKLLVEGKSNVDVDSKGARYDRTPLSWAAANGHEVVAKLLLEKGAEVDAKDTEYGRTPLSWAAGNGHEAVAKLLLKTLDRGAEVDAKDTYGQTPLSWAAGNGHVAVAKLLLHRGAEVDAKDDYGRTPLSWAVGNGHEAVAKLLLKTLDRGAEVDAKDDYGRTPLSWAARNRHEAVAKLLLEQGPEVDAKDTYSQTPLF
ncbi:hypothetical protein VE01_01233 [Pseudogymnoascus verrucosus]|uniref:Uncharacterized protein n=1 Tax=Pseudogymnoascus verrucosus TaxID=342668 RepID=A0A1B8GY82_9PEZI|nr:uncharacterized protein VE01_01233 [Pseudogymnoascus verrucosus]OBU00767.2 hypothetical protein VE01_01233 [Pseudogymnoascus verrucosus]